MAAFAANPISREAVQGREQIFTLLHESPFFGGFCATQSGWRLQFDVEAAALPQLLYPT
jgi:hypothetical protein